MDLSNFFNFGRFHHLQMSPQWKEWSLYFPGLNLLSFVTVLSGESRISEKGVHIKVCVCVCVCLCVGVGGPFADFISFFLNIP